MVSETLHNGMVVVVDGEDYRVGQEKDNGEVTLLDESMSLIVKTVEKSEIDRVF